MIYGKPFTMFITLTKEMSDDVLPKFGFASEVLSSLKSYFQERFYGEDLKSIFIGLICVNPQFENFFKVRKPKYEAENKTTANHGIQVTVEAKTLSYDVKLDFQTVISELDIKRLLAVEILKSLDVIKTVKKIKDFDLDRFHSDLEEFFRANAWL